MAETQTDWRTVIAGPELDRLIAASPIIGWRYSVSDDESGWELADSSDWAPLEDEEEMWSILAAKQGLGWDLGDSVPLFSSTWAGAGLVIEAMEARGWMLQQWHSYPRWRAEFMSRQPDPNHWRGSGLLKADTAPLAICRAALAALEVQP